ncbi:MAG: hypothetical protein JXO72_01240 [Vicinamibacteria bacterium]|nr:hypothetical protein [Vicinamibacteria bacterium]
MGGRSPQYEFAGEVYAPPPRHSWSAAFATGVLVFFALLANGRAVPGREAQVVAQAAMSVLLDGAFDLDEQREMPAASGQGRPATPWLASYGLVPLLALARIFFHLDSLLAELVGKLLAAFLAGSAAAFLVLAIARRHGETAAFRAALVFALCSSVAALGLGLTRHSLTLFFLCIVLFGLSDAEANPRWAGRMALPLSLTLVADPLTAILVAVVAVGVLAQFPRQILTFILWGLPGAVLALVLFTHSHSPFASLACGAGHAALLLSPSGGVLFFASVTLVAGLGVVRAFRGGERFRALTLGGAAFMHCLVMGCLGSGLDGNSWGFLGMTAALPLLFFFLPDGLLGWPRLGWLLAALSCSIQLIGAFGGAQRRSEASVDRPGPAHNWSIKASPLLRWIRERVVILNVPVPHDGRIAYREHRLVILGKQGSRVVFGAGGPELSGVEATLSDVHLLGAARTEGGRLILERPGDGLFIRVPRAALMRELQLRVIGRGRGSLTIEERTFWTADPPITRCPISPSFRIRRRYHYPESGGDEILIRLENGRAAVSVILLVGPSEPDEVFTL